MTSVVAEFDRSNPLFERNVVSFEVVTQSIPSNNNNNASSTTNDNNNNNKRNGNFTVRILEGRRSSTSSNEGERVIRFEMSNECNLVGDSLPTHHHQQCTPSRSNRATPIIHAPFMTVDLGGGVGQGGHHSTMMQGPTYHHQSPHTRLQPQQKLLNLPIELYELEVGESDFAALRRDQALLVDFNSFSDSLISLLQCCEFGSEEKDEGSWSSTHQQTFQDTTSNQYGQQQPYDESASGGGWNGSGQGGGVSRQSMTGHQYEWGSNNNNNNGSWRTPSHQQQGGGMNYHGQRMMSSPFANNKMNCSSSMPVSTYACRLEVDDLSNDSAGMQQWRSTQQSNSNNSLHARFSIVESNQFRELTHLALNLNVGTDKSVRCYLSSRYVSCCCV